MTIPYITVPFQTQNTLGAFGALQSPFGIGQSSFIPNSYALGNVFGQTQFVPSQTFNSHGYGYGSGLNVGGVTTGAMPVGIGQQTLGNGTQVVAIVPVSQGNQSLYSGPSSQYTGTQYAGTQYAGTQCSAYSTQTQPLAIECGENGSEYLLAFDVPGIDAEDLEISVSGNTLQINGTRKGMHEAGVMSYSEIPTGSFSRAVALPFEVTGDKSVNTCLENGVLRIRVNKQSTSEKRTASRKMKIG